MLFYYKSYQLSLDRFVRLEISKKLKCIIDNINENDLPSHRTYGQYITILNDPYSKNSFNKSKLIVELSIYDMRNKVVYSTHFNPYKHTFTKINFPEYIPTQYRRYRKNIKYKSMNLPLGKLRVRHFKSYLIRR